MRCINERFLAGCQFDEAYPNPCLENDVLTVPKDGEAEGDSNEIKLTGEDEGTPSVFKQPSFTDEQQMKLRNIATRGSLLDILVENSLLNNKNAAKLMEPIGNGGNVVALGGETLGSRPQDRIIIYLLIAMVALTIFVTVAMIVVLLNWSKLRASDETPVSSGTSPLGSNSNSELVREVMRSRGPRGSVTSNYLANQHHVHSRRSGSSQYRHRTQYAPQYVNSRSRLVNDLDSNLVTVTKGRRYPDDIDNSAL